MNQARVPGGSLARQIALTTVAEGRATTAKQIKAAVKGLVSGKPADDLITGLVEDGHLVRIHKPDGWHLRITVSGLALLPSRQPEVTFAPYVPPKMPPRRAGSMDFAACPSIYS